MNASESGRRGFRFAVRGLDSRRVVSWTTDGVTWHTTAVEPDGSVLLEGPGFRVRVTGLPLEADRPGYLEEWRP